MAIILKGNTAWRFVEGRRRAASNDLPQRVETWHGAYNALEDFLGAYPIGAAHAGGYITAHDIRDTAPKGEVDLIVAYPPDFTADLKSPFTATKTFQKSAPVTDTILFPGADSIQAVRRISARVYGTKYRYYAETQPDDARHDSTSSGKNPKLLRDSIVVTAKFSDGTESSLRYSSKASAPASVRTAIDMDIRDSIEDFSADPVAGTPWYSCTDAVIRGYEVVDDA